MSSRCQNRFCKCADCKCGPNCACGTTELTDVQQDTWFPVSSIRSVNAAPYEPDAPLLCQSPTKTPVSKLDSTGLLRNPRLVPVTSVPVASVQRAPLASVQRAPLASVQRTPLASVQRAPLASVQRAPLAPVQRAPLASAPRAPLASAPRAPLASCANLSTAQLDDICRRTNTEFQRFDPNSTILPGIGLPSQNNGVCTILHGMGPGATNLKINGLESKSPLSNAALFSTECSDGKFINLYEMMLPDGVSKTPGAESNAELYAKELAQEGINVAGSHWHWWGTTPFVAAIHHQSVGTDPVAFAQKTVKSLTNYRDRMHSGQYS